jgi:hypothetical protein
MPISKHSTLPEMKDYIRKNKLKIKLTQKKADILAALDKGGHIHKGQKTGTITSKNMPKTTPSQIKMSVKPSLNTKKIEPRKKEPITIDKYLLLEVLDVIRERNNERIRTAPTETIVLKAPNLVEWDDIAGGYPSDEEDQSEAAIDEYVNERFDDEMFFNWQLNLNFKHEWTNSWGLQKWEGELTLKQLLELYDFMLEDDNPISIDHITDVYFDGGERYIIEDGEVRMTKNQIRRYFVGDDTDTEEDTDEDTD